ncbi:hypothetical protein [Streptomyces sp. NPDC055189]
MSVNGRIQPEAESSDYVLALRDGVLGKAPVESVATGALRVAFELRVEGEDEEYVRQLAESETPWPPIVVHRVSMTVVDGVHRLRAAVLRGEERIAVRFFEGDVGDARLLSVAANVVHGRALSVADRVAAAGRIFEVRPGWSDRAVGAVAGLSAKKVAQVRRGRGGEVAELGGRMGRDGRVRPVSSARGRELACELIRENPAASLRQIARRAGISPATVADVRDRIRRGEDPLPPRQRLAVVAPGEEAAPGGEAALNSGTAARARPVAALETAPPECAGTPADAPGEPLPHSGAMSLVRSQAAQRGVDLWPRGGKGPVELLAIFDVLRRDPSLRHNEAGRNVLRMLDACAAVVRDRRRIVDTVPAHCKESMSRLVDGYAEVWQLLADDLRRAGMAGMGDAGLENPSSLGA